MDNGDNGASGMHDSFLTAGGQYIVQAEDGDETLGISGDSMDAGDKDGEPLREQDRFLPIANVARIMKNAIPKSGKIAKDAKECVQECVSEFVSFITSEASDRCHQEKRKTINGEDILFAMSTLGFDNYVEPLKLYLQKYREAMKGEKTISTATVTDCTIEDLEDNSYSNQNLNPSILPDQNNVIYTTAYPPQVLNNMFFAQLDLFGNSEGIDKSEATDGTENSTNVLVLYDKKDDKISKRCGTSEIIKHS